MNHDHLFFASYLNNSKESVLKMDFSSLYHEYEVVIEMEKENTKTKIEYTAGVKYEKRSPSGNAIISIHKLTKTFINEMEPDLISEKISALAGSIFTPLQIELNRKGEAIQLADYESILKKWKKVQEDLKKNYAGQTLNSYIECINHALKSPESVFEKLKKDWFLSLYCIPLYTKYTNPPEKEIWRLPSLLKGEKTRGYFVSKSSENLEDSDNSILIFVQNIDNPDAFANIYTLDNKTKLIKSVEAVITEKECYSIRVEIQCIKIHKNEKENTPIPEKEKDFDEEAAWQKYQRKKKGFWGRLFDE